MIIKRTICSNFLNDNYGSPPGINVGGGTLPRWDNGSAPQIAGGGTLPRRDNGSAPQIGLANWELETGKLLLLQRRHDFQEFREVHADAFQVIDRRHSILVPPAALVNRIQ